ncbi:P-loop NTPase fold protein [Saccharothrix saharensis]|uniref:P-loop NTPase fold protein n=1 Tax=Saccharothrix saharensis TaxID=571190 RepID=UPI00114DFD52|nr:P-loop NTPase fold protein [Saccharothrix saharensis]
MKLGNVDGVAVAVCVTAEPWDMGVDALVVSVGETLGDLGSVLADRFPTFDQAVSRVNLARIAPSDPEVVRLRGIGSLALVVLASPHGDYGLVDTSSVVAATRAAIRTAAREGATGVALPLLATGALGLPPRDVAAAVVPAVLDVLRLPSRRGLRQVVLFGRDAEVVDAVVRRWSDHDRPPAEAEAPTSVAEPERATPVDRPDERRVSDDLAGGVSSDLVDPTEPIPLARDRLGVATYASMLAAVIAERATPTPLSVGVFGDWGSGKSFFMGMLRGRIGELAESGSPKYCRRVVQIGFNAWHYADTNLWASLADVIFRALADADRDPHRQRGELRRLLAETVDRHDELAELNQRAEEEVARLKAKVDEADRQHVTGARDLLIALRESTRLRERLDRVWSRIGVADEVEQGRLLSQQLRDSHADVDALRRLPSDRQGKVALAAAGVVLGVTAAAAVVAPLITWLGGVAGLALATVGGGLLLRARKGLGELRVLAEDIRGGLDRIHEERVREQVSDTVDLLRKAEADQLVAQAQLDEVVTHVGELGRQLANLDPARRMSAFVAAKGEAYTRDLGVVSVLRRDFEQLVALLADWRANPDADRGGQRPVDRIVLHIDDLDRCEPRQVVQVMEAVHLLLAMDLFVVVVGVDPRWLVRSLRDHYAGVLDGDTAASPWRVLPEDYLEKIINIPFTLPGMARGRLGEVLRSMAEVEAHTSVAGDGPDVPRADPGDDVPEHVLPVEPGAQLDTSTPAPLPARPLTEREMVFLAALDPLVDTPRAAKRLFNIYRMIRATRDLGDAARFLGDDERPGEFQAVVVLLGIVAVAPSLAVAVLDAPPAVEVRGGLVHRDQGGTWASFAADLRPDDGHSPVVGRVTPDQEGRWLRLHDGLEGVTRLVTLPGLAVFQEWTPHVRRFSYFDR